jgi:hypothetical protein
VDIMVKKALPLLIVAFAIFYVLAQPKGAGDAVQSASGVAAEGFRQLARFVTALFT